MDPCWVPSFFHHLEACYLNLEEDLPDPLDLEVRVPFPEILALAVRFQDDLEVHCLDDPEENSDHLALPFEEIIFDLVDSESRAFLHVFSSAQG